MSDFQRIQTSSLRQEAIPLSVAGVTCDSFRIRSNGKWLFVKCLKEELQDDPRYDALFKKEFEIGKDLSHPNLVRYDALERTTDGLCMLMDYVDGETLAERIEKDPRYFLDRRNFRSFMKGILECLGYLHSNHIIHLDLKPENIMLRRVDNSPVILDLGFCYTDAYSSMIGRSDIYAAPEQFEPSPEGIDCRTDLYALGGIVRMIDDTVYEKTGKHVAPVFRNLSEACLHQNIDERPCDVSACLKIIEKKKTALTCALAGAMMIAAVLIISGRHPGFSDRDGTQYRILSRFQKTCEVVGWEKPDSIAGPYVYIKPEMEYHKKVYRTVSISDRAFEGDSSILSVFIPEGIESIGRNAFHDCRSISSITIPNSVRKIGSECFWDARGLEEIVLPSSLEEIEYNTFVYCCSLKRIILPERLRVIGKDSFVSCHALEEVSMPSSLEVISRGAFYDCKALRSISIPESVTSIGDYAFDGCVALCNVYNYALFPQQVTSIFGSRAKEIKLHVRESAAEGFSKAPIWSDCIVAENILLSSCSKSN